MRIIITGGSGFIGAYLIDDLMKIGGYEIVNIDDVEPRDKIHIPFWKQVSILNKEKMFEVFHEFQPECVVHLAARTDTDPLNSMKDYISNTEGTANVLSAIKACRSIKRVIITSTQFVHQRNGMPKHDEDYAPHTVYGESKVITEKLTKEANLDCCWTIIRPTNIWGPRHPRYPKEFWRVLKMGRYFHPGYEPVVRSYGYVGNVTNQIIQILSKEPNDVNKKVLYVGDAPINLYDWTNGFSLSLTGNKVRIVPRFFVKTLALVGDILSVLKLKFPITSSRYKSMTEDNPVPMDETFKLLGKPKYSLQHGIAETINWLKSQDEFWISK
ncbi:MAG TPA: NAD(P)-dependent oxidoreductase [Cyclobacteriaceae bacterium]|jgi:nucleoside-diphosphate-sugar epimerase|nr:NAD(P)-dependent oxidoreductase [Cyclobacteriaceae bacterium]